MIFMRKCTKKGNQMEGAKPPKNLSFSDGDTCGVPWEPKATKMEPKATKMEPKGAQSYQNGAPGYQNGAPRPPKLRFWASKLWCEKGREFRPFRWSTTDTTQHKGFGLGNVEETKKALVLYREIER